MHARVVECSYQHVNVRVQHNCVCALCMHATELHVYLHTRIFACFPYSCCVPDPPQQRQSRVSSRYIIVTVRLGMLQILYDYVSNESPLIILDIFYHALRRAATLKKYKVSVRDHDSSFIQL